MTVVLDQAHTQADVGGLVLRGLVARGDCDAGASPGPARCSGERVSMWSDALAAGWSTCRCSRWHPRRGYAIDVIGYVLLASGVRAITASAPS